MLDKRAHKRYKVQFKADILTNNEILHAITSDLSEGGLRVILDKRVQQGDQFKLTLFLTEDDIEDPDLEPLTLSIYIKWCSRDPTGNYVAGAQFIDIKPAMKVRLRKLLKFAQ